MRKTGKKRLFLLMAAVAALLFICGFDSQEKKVYDDGGLLTDTEEAELQELLIKTAQRVEQDLIVVTTQDNRGKEARDYADDFYDDHGFGYEKKNGSGVLFLIDMDGRTFYISTAGSAIKKYTDAEIEDTLDVIMPYMRDGDYAGACRAFVTEAERCLNGKETAENDYRDEKKDQFAEYPGTSEEGWKKALSLKRLAIVFSISAAISAFVVLIISWNRKTRMSVSGTTYLKNHGPEFRERSDQFTHTTVVTRHIPQNTGGSGSSGHSSSHTSRSGHSHGGGGRSFFYNSKVGVGHGSFTSRDSKKGSRSSSHTSRSGAIHGGGGRSFSQTGRGSRSSSHTSRSGRSHGGGGRGF
ncbi:MAG: TPM domain-containing protein [Lachnospiraceae bacterium]|nr:TPM domain-containing protein [Lachnospiraceae bacterium]